MPQLCPFVAWRSHAACLLMLTLGLGSCSSSGARPPLAEGAPLPAGLQRREALPQLPAPADIGARAARTVVNTVDGIDFHPLYSQRTSLGWGPACDMLPDWSTEQPDTSRLAFALFELVPDVPSVAPKLHLAWYLNPPPAGVAWVAVANFERNSWEWSPWQAGFDLPLDLQGRHINSQGRVLAVVLLTGELGYSLNRVRIGNNTPPAPDINISHPSSPAPFLVTLNATKSDDPGGSIVSYEYDLDGDGTYEHNTVYDNVAFYFDQQGAFTCRARLTDDEGATAVLDTGWHTGYTQQWSSTGSSGDTTFRDCVVAPDGSYYICGECQPLLGNQQRDALLVKYNADGSEAWARSFGSPGRDFATALDLSPNGVYLAGRLNFNAGLSSAFIAHFDGAGSCSWQRSWGGSTVSDDVWLAADNSNQWLYACTSSEVPVNNEQAVLLKLSDSGDWLWTRLWGGVYDDSGRGVALDSLGMPLLHLYTETATRMNSAVVRVGTDGTQFPGGISFQDPQYDFDPRGLALRASDGSIALYGGVRLGSDGGPYVINLSSGLLVTGHSAFTHDSGIGLVFRDGTFAADGKLWLAGFDFINSTTFQGRVVYSSNLSSWTTLLAGNAVTANQLSGIAANGSGVLLVGQHDGAPSKLYDDAHPWQALAPLASPVLYTTSSDMNQTLPSSAVSAPLTPATGATGGGTAYVYYAPASP